MATKTASKGNPNWTKGGPSPNPSGKRLDAAERTDGWSSLYTGIGVAGKDKGTGVTFAVDPVEPAEAEQMWRGDYLAARIIETLPNEMLREGWTLKIADEADAKDRADTITAKCEDLDLDAALWQAMAYRRAYGGSAILLGVNDGQKDLAKPIDMERIQSIDWLTVLDRRELTVATYYEDPLAPKFGKPATYTLATTTTAATPGKPKPAPIIHESRLVVFAGIQVARRGALGWGDSVLTRCRKVLADFGISWSAAATLLQDFSVAVFKLKDLANLLANDKSGKFGGRMRAMAMAKSIVNAVVIDRDEDFERKTTSVAGMVDVLEGLGTLLAAAADMPKTLLFGQSPGGLNATGDSDIRFFYDRVAAQQRRELLPAITTVIKCVMRAAGGKEPDKWAVTFNPLWQESAKTKAEARYIQAQTDKIYIEAQVLSPDVVGKARFAGDEFSFETEYDPTDAPAEDDDPEPPADDTAPPVIDA